MRTIMILVLERFPMTRPYAPLRLLSALVVTVLALLGLTLPASASLAVPAPAPGTRAPGPALRSLSAGALSP